MEVIIMKLIGVMLIVLGGIIIIFPNTTSKNIKWDFHFRGETTSDPK